MNLITKNYNKSLNNRNKLYNLDKFINKTNYKQISHKGILNPTEKKIIQTKRNYNRIFNSYSYTYSKKKSKKNNSNNKYEFKTSNYNNNIKTINLKSNKNNKKDFLKLNNYLKDQKTSLISLNKFITKKSKNINKNGILLKAPFEKGLFSYKQNNNIDNFQISNISNIKQKLNSSIHHMNSSSSLNTIDNVLNNNNNEAINNKNNLRNLILKNKIYKENSINNKLNYIDVNKSTKSTKSRSMDLNKNIIKPFNDNIKTNYKKNSISSVIKKNEFNSCEDPFSIQESIQLYKFKSNEFDDFDNYKNINLDYENINNMNFNYNKDMNENSKIRNETNISYKNDNRRLIVEYLKILKKKFKNFSVEEICKINNIDEKVLNLDKKKDLKGKISQLDYSEHQNSIFNISPSRKEKINYLKFLSTPRIMFLINEMNEKVPYIFFLSPNISNYDDGIERYSFKWININNSSDNNSYDLFHLKKCRINNKEYKRFDIIFEEYDCIEENENFYSTFIIDALSFELANNYVNGLNYFIIKK